MCVNSVSHDQMLADHSSYTISKVFQWTRWLDHPTSLAAWPYLTAHMEERTRGSSKAAQSDIQVCPSYRSLKKSSQRTWKRMVLYSRKRGDSRETYVQQCPRMFGLRHQYTFHPRCLAPSTIKQIPHMNRMMTEFQQQAHLHKQSLT